MTDYERIEKVILYLEEHFREQPSLKELAETTGLSEFHFHRLFTRWARLTPKDFVKMLTINHAKKLLQQSHDLLTVSHESGLSSPGRLHDLIVSIEAVTPGEFKSKGKGVKIKYGYHDSPFGKVLIGLTTRGICFLSFCDDGEVEALNELKVKWANAECVLDQEVTKNTHDQIFGQKSQGQLSLLLMGSSFQVKVWEALLKIPEGQVRTYGDIAEAIDSPKSSRAVGSAIGSNALAWIIPCHRVIRATGHFSDYRWNPVRKKAMIAWEQGHTTEALSDEADQ